MERWLPTALAALALALGAWNAWSLSSLSTRIEAASEAAAVAEASSARPSDDDGRFSHASRRSPYSRDRVPEGPTATRETHDPDAGGPSPVDDPEFRERVASAMAAEEERRDAERRARFEDSMRTEVVAFADEEDLDEVTTKALLTQVSERSDAFRSVRDDIRSGALTWAEGRAEMEEMRESGSAEIEKLLGAERAERFEARLWGDRDGGSRGGPPWGGRP